MKVAILFHGHLRSFRMTAKYFKRNVYDHLRLRYENVDVFMHTWDTEEFLTETWHEGAKLAKKTSKKEVENSYTILGLCIESQHIENPNNKIFGRPYESIKYMWYSFYKAWELMKLKEIETGKKYDKVIITRPDVQNYTPLFIDEIETKNCLWQCQIFTKIGASDVFLYGDRAACRSVLDFYTMFDELHSSKNISGITNNEYVFNRFIRSNTTVRKSQYCMPRDWRILRSWWKEDEIVGHRKWDKDLSIKEISNNELYSFFRRNNDRS